MKQIRVNDTDWVSITGEGEKGSLVLNTTGHLAYITDDETKPGVLPLPANESVSISLGTTIKIKLPNGSGLITVYDAQ